MVEKLILTGAGNDGFRYNYRIIKNESFKDIFPEFMVLLGFNKKEIVSSSFYSFNKEGEEVKFKISNFKDCYDNYNNKDYDVDVFYGSKKIILVIRTKRIKNLIRAIEKYSKFIKTKKIKSGTFRIKKDGKRK